MDATTSSAPLGLGIEVTKDWTNMASYAPTNKIPPLTVVAFVASFLLPIVGVVLGVLSLVRLPRQSRGRGLAIASVVIGAVLTALTVLGWMSWLSLTA
jgi:Sec-independent protein secretion pathway component TatC